MEEKRYDLEERTFAFAKRVAEFCNKLPRTPSNIEYVKQVVRSSGSVGANYIEANESLGKKDFGMRVKISRKEAKETEFWLRLIKETNANGLHSEAEALMDEASQLRKILSTILLKTERATP